MESPTDSKGFPPGVAEQMVVESYRRYMNKCSSSLAIPVKASEVVRTSSARSSHISTWNGGVTQRYRWSQSLSDITVAIGLPSQISNKNDLSVVLTDSRLTIKFNGDVFVDGTWTARIHASESTWIIEDGSSVILSLEKAKEDWWNSLLVGDPEIDTTKVESKKRIDEYHPETQAAIRKILHDEQMKRTGQDPATLKLKEAWDADGSPFKGTPFDPSVLSNTSSPQ